MPPGAWAAGGSGRRFLIPGWLVGSTPEKGIRKAFKDEIV
jgi:hypothetical protein